MRRGYRIRARMKNGKLYVHKQIYKEEEKKKARGRLLELKRNCDMLEIIPETLEIVPVERANAAMRMGDDQDMDVTEQKNWEDEERAMYNY